MHTSRKRQHKPLNEKLVTHRERWLLRYIVHFVCYLQMLK